MSDIEKPIGGTELQYLKLCEVMGDKLNDLNIMVTYGVPDTLRDDKINVLWQHNGLDDMNMHKMMQYKPFVEQIDQFVFVSNYQYDLFSRMFNIPSDRCHVIRNAITPIEYKEKTRDKIKLIYTSTPWRGLSVLLEAFDRLKRDDVELDVFSGLKIYGKQFVEQTGSQFDALFAKAKSQKNVNYVEYAPNEDIKKAVQQAHIMAYPSVFEETSCLAAIEAMAAGCKFVGTNLGALLETVNVYGEMIPIDRGLVKNPEALVDRYVELLNYEIDRYWDEDNQKKLKEQSDHFNHYYNWETRKKDWERFINIAKVKGKV
jgi:glycosyltransferase involved in cell wall biosynthesis